ncbi:hypothetical protein [Enterovibrio norvegicus]|uniref:hypothetical protein n=1 Tax=Enterovibrio norvegicus TaxID=188144 RepID=UPI0004745ACB|nr:hypothetical protein [Enterovibrio norvegicus]OEF59059.1 hypothetical protein A1OU_07165 [Enterovibrio norvegicus]
MPAIRYRHNYKSIILSASSAATYEASTGQSVPALLKDGSLIYFPFGGFVERRGLTHAQFVKLVDVIGFSMNEDESGAWEDVTEKQVLGVFLKGKYYVVLDGGKVIGLMSHK